MSKFARVRSFLPSVLLLIVLILGAYLRLYRISEYMTFLGDEGRDMLVMKRMIMDHSFTLLGPTASVGGFFLGPIYYYFMLPFVWVSGMNPAGAAVMVALFGIATIYLVYRAGRDMFGVWVGLAASAMYAVSPVVIAYSRSSWNPNIVPFFSTALIYALWRSVVKKETGLLFWVGVLLGIGLQLHYLFLFLVPVVILWYALFGRSFPLRQYLLGIAGFIAGFGPFLLFELRHGFPNTIAIYHFLREGEGTGLSLPVFWKNVTDVSYRLFGRLVFRLPPSEQRVNIPFWMGEAWSIVTTFGIYSSIGFFLSAVSGVLPDRVGFSAKRDEHRVLTGALFLLWLFVPLALFGLYKKGIYDYYFGIFFTLPFFAVAGVLQLLRTTLGGRVIAAAAVAGILILNLDGMPFKYPPNNQLEQTRRIAKAALEKTGGKPFNFALITGGNSDHAYRYFFEIWGNAPVAIQNEQLDPGRTTVTDQLIVICETQECKPLGHPLWEIAGFGRAEIAGEWQVSFVKIMKLVHYKN